MPIILILVKYFVRYFYSNLGLALAPLPMAYFRMWPNKALHKMGELVRQIGGLRAINSGF